MSLKVALEQLGFVKCHHMQEVVRSRAQVDAWYALSRGDAVDWDRVFEGFQAACDWPSSAYWEPLARQYPDALVILTVRDPQRWYESASTTIYQASSGIPGWITAISPRIRYLREMIFATIWNGVFGGRFEDREHALQVFREHTERVKRVVPPDRLLVFEAKEGWEPLCAFLGVPVPDGPYPHVNEAVSMKRAIVVLRVLRWLPLALVAALALFLTTLAR